MERAIAEKGLPALIAVTSDTVLRSGLESHLVETKVQAQRLEKILTDLTGEVDTENCKAIHAIISEASDSLKDAGDEVVRDVTIIYCGQQVEHHEIAVYGTLRAWADLLDRDDDMDLLDLSLQEEKNADVTLSQSADEINVEADVVA